MLTGSFAVKRIKGREILKS